MDPQPEDLTATEDLSLVQAARAGDRLAFGVLYLRHHAAAWRIACVASRFSADAVLAVIEGFTRVFSALPAEPEEFEKGGVTFRPYLLACVRQAALDRAVSAGRAELGSGRHPGRPPASRPPPPAPLAGLAPDGEVVLSAMEHHVARGALAALPERTRVALWLSDVEAMTPREVGGILGFDPDVVKALSSEARAGVRSAQDSANGRHEVRADCRFTVDHLGAYNAGSLDPKMGVLVRSHLDLCPPCRMRMGELANFAATLAAAVPAAPLLGGETQHHWLTSAAQVRPADRLLPPGLAAVAPGRHFPDVLRPVRDRRTRRPGKIGVAGMAGAVPVAARKAGRRAWPAVPALTLVVAWLAVMLSLPQLMQPETAPGPGGLALPAVQAYVPDFLPGAAKPAGSKHTKGSRPSSPVAGAAGGSSELAAQLTSGTSRSNAGSSGSAAAEPTVELSSTATAPVARPARVATTVEAVPAAATTVVSVVPLQVTAPSPAPATGTKPEKGSKQAKKEATKVEKEARKAEKAAKKAEKESGRKNQPASRGKVVTA